MTENLYEFFVLGSTGLCGGSFVKYLNMYVQKKSSNSALRAIIRKPYSNEFMKAYDLTSQNCVQALVEPNSKDWATKTFNSLDLMSNASDKIYFSGLGTTKADAGSIEAQRKIDLDLNYEMACEAKSKGYTTFVLVSSAGASSGSMFPYLKMKGELEDKLRELNFKNLIILRPGALLGDRLGKHKGFGNSAAAYIGQRAYGTMFSKFLGYPVHGDEVGKAGVILALKAAKEEKGLGVQEISSREIIEIAQQSDI